MRIGRIVIAIAALLLPAGTLAVTAVEEPAWAVTVGTGLEHCYGPVTGSITTRRRGVTPTRTSRSRRRSR